MCELASYHKRRSRTMKKILLGIVLALLSGPAFAQVSPYPDTSATGSAPEMIQKLTLAQSAFDQVEREISDNQRKFDGLKPMTASLEEENQNVKARSDFLHKDFDQKVDAFNAACASHPIPLNSPEWANCQRWQAQMTQRKRDYEAENSQLLVQHDNIKSRYDSVTQQQLLYQVQIQKLRNWKSQIE